MRVLNFGPFVFDLKIRQLQKDGINVRLSKRAADILVVLLEHKDTVVSKTKLKQSVWPLREVDDSNLTVQLSALRRALGTSQGGGNYIHTIQGRGYRFVIPVFSDDPKSGQLPGSSLQDIDPTAKLANNLPIIRAPFIGRTQELAATVRALKQSCVVTIYGLGGIGKSRVALAAATQMAVSDATVGLAGVWLVDLSGIANGEAAVGAFAKVLGLNPFQRDPIERISRFLGSKQTLLILDNCEHLLNQVASTVVELLDRCAALSVLVTSREAMGLSGETLIRLDPFEVPPVGSSLTVGSALDFAAVAFFVQRAAAAGGFALTNENLQDVVSICCRLDGIASALEQAASRVAVMGIAKVADRLARGMGLIAASRRDIPERHRTLDSTLEWSFRLLTTQQKLVVRRLAVFAGSFSIEAAEAVLADDKPYQHGRFDAAAALPKTLVMEQLANLAMKSVIVTKTESDTRRFGLLDTIRLYCLRHLSNARERSIIRHRHAQFFADFFNQADLQSCGLATDPQLAVWELDVDNLRTALDWCFGSAGDRLTGFRLAAASADFWGDISGWFEGYERLDQAFGCLDADTPDRTRADLCSALARLSLQRGQARGRLAIERAIELYRALPDSELALGRALLTMDSYFKAANSLDRSRRALQEASRLLEAGENQILLGKCRLAQASLDGRQGDLILANRSYDAANALFARSNNKRGQAEHFIERAKTQNMFGDFRNGSDSIREAIEILAGTRHRLLMGRAYGILSLVHLREGRVKKAIVVLETLLDLVRSRLTSECDLWLYDYWALFLCLTRNMVLSANIIGYSKNLMNKYGGFRSNFDDGAHQEVLILLNSHFGDLELAELISAGEMWCKADLESAVVSSFHY